MPRLLIGGVIAAAVAASVPAFAEPAPAAGQAAKSRADLQAAAQKRFLRMDADRDGFVTKAEADALTARRGERREQRANRFDPAKIFAKLDADGNGSITRAEAEAARTARAERRQAKGKPAAAHAVAFGNLFERADANRDGILSRAEFDAAPPRGGKRHAGMRHGRGKGGMAARLITRGDANQDGRVSLAEAQQQAAARFDRLDRNRDGQVTREERIEARQQRRAQRKPS